MSPNALRWRGQPGHYEVWTYHTERARLRGPDVETDAAAFEYAARAKLPGWPISL